MSLSKQKKNTRVGGQLVQRTGSRLRAGDVEGAGAFGLPQGHPERASDHGVRPRGGDRTVREGVARPQGAWHRGMVEALNREESPLDSGPHGPHPRDAARHARDHEVHAGALRQPRTQLRDRRLLRLGGGGDGGGLLRHREHQPLRLFNWPRHRGPLHALGA